jgi:hypothetical protein
MVGAFILITLGVLLLLNNLYPEFDFLRTWPVILIVIGLAKVAEYLKNSLGSGRPRREDALGPDRERKEQP